MVEEEKKATIAAQRNWADEDDEGGDDEDVAIGGTIANPAKQAQAEENQNADEATTEAAAVEQPKPFVSNKPRQKRERNIYGDFVVTTINIKEREIPQEEVNDEEEEEESSEEEEEEVVAEPVEEVKKGK